MAFYCKASGKPMPSFMWYKDGQKIEVDEQTTMECSQDMSKNESDSLLEIRDVIPVVHDGKITVEAMNEVGTVAYDAELIGKVIIYCHSCE